jgi:hypothetical protein
VAGWRMNCWSRVGRVGVFCGGLDGSVGCIILCTNGSNG